MMIINNKYEIGQVVYLKTCVNQWPRIVLSMLVYKDGEIMYKVGCGTEVSEHYEFEIASEVNVITKLES